MPRVILTYYDANGNIETFNTTKTPLTIGSSPQCDLLIDGLEAQACEIYLADEGFYVKQLGGKLAINDRPGSGYVNDNDTLTLGGWLSLRFGLEELRRLLHLLPHPNPPLKIEQSSCHPEPSVTRRRPPSSSAFSFPAAARPTTVNLSRAPSSFSRRCSSYRGSGASSTRARQRRAL